MNKIKTAIRWRRKYSNQSCEYDSTGYFTPTDSHLSASEFIMRPVDSCYSIQNNIYDEYPSTSYSSSSGICTDYGSLRTLGDSLTACSSRCSILSESLNTLEGDITDITSLAYTQQTQLNTIDETSENDQTISNKEDDDNTQNDSLFSEEDSSTFRANTCSPLVNFDRNLEELFNELEVQQAEPCISGVDTISKRKKISIKEPDDTSKIYYNAEESVRKKTLKPMTNLPRSILKKRPSLFPIHIYEEIEDDHLHSIPEDIRPDLPIRPYLQPLRIFPPCNAFQPRKHDGFPLDRRRKKIPSLHRSSTPFPSQKKKKS